MKTTNREKVLDYLRKQSDADYPLDAVQLCKTLNIKQCGSLFGDLQLEGKIRWDDTYKGWRLNK